MQARPGRLLRALAATAIVAASLTWVLAWASPSSAAFQYSISVTPADALADGQLFTVTVHGPPGMTVLNSGFCDPAMPTATDDRGLTEWCTDTVGNGQAGGYVPSDPDGVAELVLRAGTGNATKTSPALGTTHSWTCDPSSPCRLPLVITPPGGDATFDVSTLLSYRDDDPTAGCGGNATDQVASSAPDRLTEQWVAWTVDDCAGRGLATSAAFENDGRALAEFTDGTVDLAYSAVAPGTSGFGAGTRRAVATPIALNATVIAAAGFYPAESSVPGRRLWRHVTDVKMSEDEAVALLSGHLGLDEDLQGSLVARNPQLAVQAGTVGFTAPSALAGPQATTFQVASRFAADAPDAWTYPGSKAKYGDQAGTALGAFADYNSLTNSLAMVNLSTGKPQYVGEIYRKLAEKPESVSLVTFYLTDLATARQLGLAPVAIGDDDHGYVLPDDSSLRAAADGFAVGDDGFVSLAPLASSEASAAGAYPLTFVEYALSPAERIVDQDCTERTGERGAIQRWLGYLSDGGQDPAVLAASGMVPLTASLRAQAKASVAQVGAAAPSSGPCAPATTSTTTTTVATPSGSGSGSFDGGPASIPGFASSGSGRLGDTASSAGSGAAPAATRAASTRTVERVAAEARAARIPRLPGPLGAPAAAAAAAMPLLVAAVSGAGRLSSGRTLAGLRSWRGRS